MLLILAQEPTFWDQLFAPFTDQWWEETLCTVLVGITCGLLGCFVVLRRMALIGDALSHAVLPGVVIAFIVTKNSGSLSLLFGALIAGLVTAVLINLVTRFSRTKEDSAIGIVFTAFFALGIILISAMPRGVHFDLKCFLFGDPLAVVSPAWKTLFDEGFWQGVGNFAATDFGMMAIICPIVVVVVVLLYHPLKLISFDPLVAAAMGLPVVLFHYLLMGMLSATVVAGLKTTGVILVVAMVITPASAAYQLTNRFSIMLLLAAVFGGVSAAAGMSLAFITNAPTGPAMVIVAATIFLLAMFFSPSHGFVFDRLRRIKLGRHIQREDVLKAVYRLGERDAKATIKAVAEDAMLAPQRVSSLVEKLVRTGVVARQGDALELTDVGRRRAVELIRSHRLWESYLADRLKLDDAAMHAAAEQLEHAHDLADDVDATLGHPQTDPQGKPIPR